MRDLDEGFVLLVGTLQWRWLDYPGWRVRGIAVVSRGAWWGVEGRPRGGGRSVGLPRTDLPFLWG